jgi:hypothetical protein
LEADAGFELVRSPSTLFGCLTSLRNDRLGEIIEFGSRLTSPNVTRLAGVSLSPLLLAEFFAEGRAVPVDDVLGLAPICVALGDHDVEYPLATLFLGFDEAQGAEVEEVTLDETNFVFAHAAALEVDRKAGEVRGGGVTFGWGGVAIVTHQLLLNFDGADCRVQLYLVVEPLVVGLAEVFYEVAGPRTAKAPIGVEPGINAERGAGTDRQQRLSFDQSGEFVVVLNARQFEAIDLFVLEE